MGASCCPLKSGFLFISSVNLSGRRSTGRSHSITLSPATSASVNCILSPWKYVVCLFIVSWSVILFRHKTSQQIHIYGVFIMIVIAPRKSIIYSLSFTDSNCIIWIKYTSRKRGRDFRLAGSSLFCGGHLTYFVSIMMLRLHFLPITGIRQRYFNYAWWNCRDKVATRILLISWAAIQIWGGVTSGKEPSTGSSYRAPCLQGDNK